MNILITHVYSRNNNGDAAILYAQLKELQRVAPQARLTISTMENTAEFPDFEGIPQVPALISSAHNRHNGRARNLLSLARSFAGAWIWASTLRMFKQPFSALMTKDEQRFLRALHAADVVVPVGGGYVQTRKKGLFGYIDLLLILQPLYLAHKIGKPTVLYSQSIGPFKSMAQQRLAARVLRRCTQINVREDKSMRYVQEMGLPPAPIQRTADAAFLLRTHDLKTAIPQRISVRLQDAAHPVVGVTARLWLPPQEQAAYETALAAALDGIIERHNATVVLIPQVTVGERNDDDRTVQSRILGHMRHTSQVIDVQDRLDFKQIKRLYGSLDYLIGTRFHSVIFALTELVPAVAIEYEHKTSGIMKDLGLDKWVLSIHDLKAQDVGERFDAIVAGRAAYSAQLQSALPPYIAQARKANDFIAELAPRRA